MVEKFFKSSTLLYKQCFQKNFILIARHILISLHIELSKFHFESSSSLESKATGRGLKKHVHAFERLLNQRFLHHYLINMVS